MNRHTGPAQRGEQVWLALIENPSTPLERSLTFHIAEALAVHSRKRVLLVDLSEADALVAPRFATHDDQLRPSLLECVHEPGLLHRHQAPTVGCDGRYYAAITTLFPLSTCQRACEASEFGDFDKRSTLKDLARCYDYLLLVTTGVTLHTVVEMVAENCSREEVFFAAQPVPSQESQALCS